MKCSNLRVGAGINGGRHSFLFIQALLNEGQSGAFVLDRALDERSKLVDSPLVHLAHVLQLLLVCRNNTQKKCIFLIQQN